MRFNSKSKEQFDEKMVGPNQKGFLFINKVFERILEPGVYKFPRSKEKKVDVYTFSKSSQWMFLDHQGVLTQDSISLRLSYQVQYRVANEEVFREHVNFDNHNVFADIDQHIRVVAETLIRNMIAGLKSEVLNEKRMELQDELTANIQEKMQHYGLLIPMVLLAKITFPKKIQELFVQQRELSIRSKIDLEKAHNQVATAKILNEAADLMSNNENVKFLQMLETMNQMATKGNHTFMIGGEYYQAEKKEKKR